MLTRKKLSILTLIFCLSFPQYQAASKISPDKISLSLRKEIEHSIVRGLKWLSSKQEDDGSWNHYPAITALVLSSFLRAHPGITLQDSIISEGFNYLKHCIQDNGGIYIDDMQSYNTAICILAFQDAKSIDFKPIIENAQNFLLTMQNDEGKGFTSDSLHYGGVSYGKEDKPANLSIMQWCLETMKLEDIEKDEIIQPFEDETHKAEQKLFWDKAITFLQRCQNLKQTNDQEYATDDGGFMYGPGTSKAGDTKSYGSMTYAGLKSFIYAKISKNDPRVKAAFNWIQKNYSIEENPGMELQGLYYNYHTMAKALNAYGEEVLVDDIGKKHHWRKELAGQLLKIQHSDGYWINENARWWENNPVLVTAYVVLALEEVLKTTDIL